jgi:hypothetical protein
MFPLHRDPGWTFPFGDDRLIPAFFLPGAPPGLRVHITRDGQLLREGVVAEEGRVTLDPALVVRAGEVLLVLPAPSAG